MKEIYKINVRRHGRKPSHLFVPKGPHMYCINVVFTWYMLKETLHDSSRLCVSSLHMSRLHRFSHSSLDCWRLLSNPPTFRKRISSKLCIWTSISSSVADSFICVASYCSCLRHIVDACLLSHPILCFYGHGEVFERVHESFASRSLIIPLGEVL